MSNRRTLIVVSLLVVIFSFADRAAAGGLSVGSLAQSLFRGTEYAGNPQFLSQPQNGPLFNFNNFTQRIEENRAGGGYTYEFFRFFGADSYGNANFLDLGPLQVQLTPDLSLGQTQLVGFHGRAGYETTFIPEVFFDLESGQRTFSNQFQNGTNTFNVEPIGYNVSLNTGIQDMEWSGNILVDSSVRINALGFYDADVRIVNRGGMTSDGIAISDEVVTDFDTGPVNISGHILLDAIGGLFQVNGNPATAAPFQIGSAAAQRSQISDELMAKAEAGERLTDEEVQILVEEMFLAAFTSDPIGTIMNGLPSTVPGFEGFALDFLGDGSTPSPVSIEDPKEVPEPGMLFLFCTAAAFATAVRPQRWRRRRLA